MVLQYPANRYQRIQGNLAKASRTHLGTSKSISRSIKIHPSGSVWVCQGPSVFFWTIKKEMLIFISQSLKMWWLEPAKPLWQFKNSYFIIACANFCNPYKLIYMDLRDDDDIEDRRGGVKIHDESNRVCTCACYRAAKPVENREICYLCIYVYHRSQGNELHSTI